MCVYVFLCVSNVHSFKIQWLKKDSNLYSASCTAAEKEVFKKCFFLLNIQVISDWPVHFAYPRVEHK